MMLNPLFLLSVILFSLFVQNFAATSTRVPLLEGTNVVSILSGLGKGLQLFDSDELLKCAESIAPEIVTEVSSSIKTFKKLYESKTEKSLLDALTAATTLLKELATLIEKCDHGEHLREIIKDINAFKERCEKELGLARKGNKGCCATCFSCNFAEKEKAKEAFNRIVLVEDDKAASLAGEVVAAITLKHYALAGEKVALLLNSLFEDQTVFKADLNNMRHVKIADPKVAAVVKVFEGILDSLDVEAKVGLEECIEDAEEILEDFKSAASGFKNGFKHAEFQLVKSGFISLGVVVRDLKAALTDCTAIGDVPEEVGHKLELLIHEFEHEHAWLEFVKSEGLALMAFHKEITEDCKNFVVKLHSKDYEGVGEAIGDIVKILLQGTGVLASPEPELLELEPEPELLQASTDNNGEQNVRKLRRS